MQPIEKELEAIRKKANGVLKPSAVVEFAEDPETALHGKFEWDDAVGAHEYRLWQAREVIRVHVTVAHADTEPTRTYVSLQGHREGDGGGYLHIKDVLSDAEWRAQLLAQALAELHAFEAKYRSLVELAGVFAAAKKVRKRKKTK